MNRLLLFVILSGTVILFDIYAYHGLKIAINGFYPSVQRAIKVFFWSLTVITLASFMFYEPLSNSDKGRKILMIIATVGVANILGKFLFAFWLFVDDIGRFAKFVWTKINPPIKEADGGVSRSEFLAGMGAISASIPLLSMGWGVVSGAHDYTVRNRQLRIKNLPESFRGYRILQISDIHCGSFWNRAAVERGIHMINDQSADAVFVTGDIVNNRADELEEWVTAFNKIEAKDGIYSVLGNHDYGDYVPWENQQAKDKNLQRLIDIQRQEMGWYLLINEHMRIHRGADSIAIVGVENWGARGRFPKYGDLSKAMQDTDDAGARLLLSHDPSHWRAQVLPEFPSVDATFSGHTHGMQFGIEVGNIKWSPVKYFYEEWADMYSSGHQSLYVNRGFGYIGYPGRFGILPEITVFTLDRA